MTLKLIDPYGSNGSQSCAVAVNHQCEKESCEDEHCKRCHRKLCPVCKGHYSMLIYADQDEGCCGGCVKVTRGDTEPFYPTRKRA